MANVGYKLYREIRDYAPADWTSGELVVALMIADDANEVARVSWIEPTELARRCRMGVRNVRKSLEKLAERGFEFRTGHGEGKDGRQVYATNGKHIEYVVPDILMVTASLSEPLSAGVDNHKVGGTTVPP